MARRRAQTPRAMRKQDGRYLFIVLSLLSEVVFTDTVAIER
jgi:hypothetical protein